MHLAWPTSPFVCVLRRRAGINGAPGVDSNEAAPTIRMNQWQ